MKIKWTEPKLIELKSVKAEGACVSGLMFASPCDSGSTAGTCSDGAYVNQANCGMGGSALEV